MTADTTQAQPAQAELAAAHPGWTIWRSNTGRWYATRKAPITMAEGNTGCVRTVHAVDPEGLAEELDKQELRAQRAAPA
ncbi:hypothetical protein [Streptosporangium canum]|uniref:hypothetical protein n=1 Tax=Streptosporangium canum TaxID=324952 RepID=UPI0033A4B616